MDMSFEMICFTVRSFPRRHACVGNPIAVKPMASIVETSHESAWYLEELERRVDGEVGRSLHCRRGSIHTAALRSENTSLK
jgi:hypothetical protein